MSDVNDPGAASPQPSKPPVKPAAPAATATVAPKAGWFASRFATAKGWFASKSKSNQLVPQGNTALERVPSNGELVTQIEQIAITSDMPLEMIVAMLSGETQDVKQVIDGFDEDKEGWFGQTIGRIVTVICYILPWIISAYAGSALGQHYSGSPFKWDDAEIAYYYIVSWGYEFALVALMTAMVRVFKRMTNGTGRSAGAILIGVLVLFLVLAGTSAAAQWILFEKTINMSDTSQVVGALFRTLATPLIDLVGAIVLAILHVRSLDHAIVQIEKKNDATIRINRKKIEAKLQTVTQAMEVRNQLKKEDDYSRKNDLANKIIDMFSENAIDVIKNSLEGKSGGGSGGSGNQSRW